MAELLELSVRRRLNPGVVLLGAALLLIFLFMAALGIGALSARQRVQAELQRIRAAGEPITPKDLDAFYQDPPAGRDATGLWLQAIRSFHSPEFAADVKELPLVGAANEELPPLDEPWAKQLAAEALLAKYRESLETMHRAAELGGAARYPVSFEQGYGIMLYHVQWLRNGAGLLQLESEVRARRQDRSQLQRRLSDTSFTDDELSAIDHHLAASDYSEILARGLAGERVCGLMVFDDPRSLGDRTPPAISTLFRSSDQALYLHMTHKMMQAAHFDGPKLRDAAADAEAELKQLAHEPGAWFRCPISAITLPSFSALVIAIQRGVAGRDAARVAVAIERFRLRRGEPPKTLEALVPEFLPEVPLDPFDGKPLRYRVDAEEYIVYSVEADGVDQGGQTTETQPGVPQDLVFCVRLSDRSRIANEGN